jgi:phage replication-related protein YjqB (UPF0714/DUF867 family)
MEWRMNLKTVIAFWALAMSNCGNEEASSPLAAGSVGINSASSESDGPFGTTRSALRTGSDYFNCVQAGNCPTPALSASRKCIKGRDYEITLTQQVSNVVVLSFHGGLIEPRSTELANAVADKFGWSHYDFSGHGTSSCLAGGSNFGRLHITATNFDDPLAVATVMSSKKAVSIHGYSDSRGNGKGTICVGGANRGQVQAFIASVQSSGFQFTNYQILAVDAANGASTAGIDCSGLTGSASDNLVNRVAGGSGGLQLEMSNAIKVDLLDIHPQFDALRTIFYGGLAAAMNQ